MAEGKHDFLIEYIGGLSSTAIDNFSGHGILDLQLGNYLRLPRKLERRSRGSNDTPPEGLFLEPDLTLSIVSEINKFQNAGKTIGQVLITGFSKGAIYAFKLATEVKANVTGASILYLGLSDIPIMPYGYKPPIPNFFTSIPENDPTRLPDVLFKPPRTLNDPEIKVTPVSAGFKKNYFQGKGNGWGPTGHHPHPSANAFFWWSSQMLGKEVHGKIINDDWINVEMPISRKLSDNDNHQQGDDEGVKRMSRDVSDLLNNLT